MSKNRLDDLLRDARAHPAEPLSAEALQQAQHSVLTRFTQEAPVAAPRRTLVRWLEAAALPAAVAGVLIAGADWFGSLFGAARATLARSTELAAPEPGWFDAIGKAMASQPWLVVCGAVGLAMLWLPPVRAALLGERE